MYDYKILGSYEIDSRLYNSHRPDSDKDYVFICDKYDPQKISDKNVTIFTEEDFFLAGKNHDIKYLECLWCPSDFCTQRYENFQFELNLGQLRKSISTVSNHSWVKGKKKLIISSDYDKIVGIKSIFHSLRILDFGIQIANSGRIYDYQSMSWLMKELYFLAEKNERDTLWNIINSRYLSKYKEMKSTFKGIIPKTEIDHVDKKIILNQILNRYDIKPSKDLLKEIVELFEC